MKRYLSAALCLLLVVLTVGCSQEGEAQYTAGTYTATVPGMQGALTVEVTVSESEIADVQITEQRETPGVGDLAAETVAAKIVENQSLAVDAVSGATISSVAVLRAVEECLEQAGANVAALKEVKGQASPTDIEETADVIIVGGGGAGLSAAVSAIDEGASVILIEKAGFVGGNSIVSGGIYNAPNPELQDYAFDERSDSLETLIVEAISEEPVDEEHKALIDKVKAEYEEYKASDKTLFDSPNWFALQTWNGGDKVGDLNMVKVLANNALKGLEWLETMGMKMQDTISHGGGALYPRTHWSTMPNGTGFIKAYTDTLEDNPNFTLMLNTTGTDLIVEGNKVIGVNAEKADGSKVTLKANKGVVLATGGFAGNDGLFMARDVGAQLVNMDQIQLLPYCHPQTGATYDIVSVGKGGVFINKEGKRFVREDGRRDEMSKAIIAQTDGEMFMLQDLDGIDPKEAVALGGQTLAYYLETNYGGYVMADTLDELAEKLNVPADALKQTVEEFNSYVESGKADPFGRVSYSGKIDNGPYYAYPRRPAVHHTMGGVLVDEQGRALTDSGSAIEGLYCAGEITGNLHGGNRLGGNAIVDFVVFGRIAGASAANGL